MRYIHKLTNWFSVKYSYRHWYQITTYYLNKRGEILFSTDRQIGVTIKSEISNKRGVLKTFKPLHTDQSVKKSRLCNGTFNYRVECYLGYFSLKKNKLVEKKAS